MRWQQRQFPWPNHAPGFSAQRTVNGHEISLRQERVECDWNGPTRLALGLRQVRIVGEHAHPEPGTAQPRDTPAHLAQANDAHSTPLGIAALKRLAVDTPLLTQGAVRLHDILGE